MLVLFTSLFKKIKESSEFRTRTRKPRKICARGFYLLDSRALKMVERTLILFSSPTKKSDNSNFLFLPIGIQKYVYNEFNTQSVNWVRDIAYDTVICRNPPIHGFTRERKDYQSSIDQHLSMFCLYENKRTSNFFFRGHNILTEGVFVTQVSSNAAISV